MAHLFKRKPSPFGRRRSTPCDTDIRLAAACIFLFLCCLISSGNLLYAQEIYSLEENGIHILFAPPQEGLARELAQFYPEVQGELKQVLGWDLIRPPFVHLIGDGGQFQQMVKSPLIVAFALPQEDLVVMGVSRIKTHPFGLRDTFKHELCHLLLHQNILGDPIPRWLDEGIAQWVSDGAGDILMDQKRSTLNRASLQGSLIPLRSLSRGFPQDDQGLTLAYQESKNFIDHLIGLSGPAGILGLLERLKQGTELEEAFLRVYGQSLSALERGWQQSLKNRITWLTYLSYHLYDLLFVFAALMSVYGAIRIMIKKRRRMKEELETDDEELRD